jgi:hypothetical protein
MHLPVFFADMMGVRYSNDKLLAGGKGRRYNGVIFLLII